MFTLFDAAWDLLEDYAKEIVVLGCTFLFVCLVCAATQSACDDMQMKLQAASTAIKAEHEGWEATCKKEQGRPIYHASAFDCLDHNGRVLWNKPL